MFSTSFFFFNDTATTEIYTLSLHDALPISRRAARPQRPALGLQLPQPLPARHGALRRRGAGAAPGRRRPPRRLPPRRGRPMSEPLLRVENLAKHYPVPKRALFQVHRDQLKAVDGISFTLEAGTTLGLVGESGCGKSTTARLVLRLVEPTAGTVRLDGVDVLGCSK